MAETDETTVVVPEEWIEWAESEKNVNAIVADVLVNFHKLLRDGLVSEELADNLTLMRYNEILKET